MIDVELYQEMIIDHYKSPRNFCEMSRCTHTADGHNPLCGDQLKIFVRMGHGKIEDISFQGAGCAISQASASLMTERLKGLSSKDALHVFDTVHSMMTQTDVDDLDKVDLEALGKLVVLSGVRKFPMRVKCASLAWHTFKAAMDDNVGGSA